MQTTGATLLPDTQIQDKSLSGVTAKLEPVPRDLFQFTNEYLGEVVICREATKSHGQSSLFCPVPLRKHRRVAPSSDWTSRRLRDQVMLMI